MKGAHRGRRYSKDQKHVKEIRDDESSRAARRRADRKDSG
jgi:hypothetical protein